MPYKSLKQARFMHAKHPKTARRWDAEMTKKQWKRLPMRVKKGKGKGKKK